MTYAPLIGFCNVDLAFGDYLVLGKLSFEIGAVREGPIRARASRPTRV